MRSPLSLLLGEGDSKNREANEEVCGGEQQGGGNPMGASRGRPVCCELYNLAENAAFCQGSGVREGITTA